MKEIHLVKKFISLLLISFCLGDTLILKDKTEYTGALIKFGTDEIIFKALPSAKLYVNIKDILELRLSDGTNIFENGILIEPEEHLRQYIKNEKINKNAENIIGCCLIIILIGFLVYRNLSFGSGFPDGPWPGDGASIES